MLTFPRYVQDNVDRVGERVAGAESSSRSVPGDRNCGFLARTPHQGESASDVLVVAYSFPVTLGPTRD